MRVISGAGEFEITVRRMTARQGALVLAGTMGVWESETIIEPADIVRMARVSLTPRVLWFLASLPVRLLLRRKDGQR
jgi:hypothetical protein